MKKLLEINNCMDCIYSSATGKWLYCNLLEKNVHNAFPYEIPADCPLPDAEDEG